MKKHLLLLSFLSILVSGIFAQSGSSCSNAITLNDNSCLNNQAFTSDVWYSATPSATHVVFKIFNSGVATDGSISSINVFSGTCSGLTLFGSKTITPGSDSIVFDTIGYISGQTYYVQAIFKPGQGCIGCPTPTNFSICMTSVTCLISIGCPQGNLCINTPLTFTSCNSNACFGGYSWTFTGPVSFTVFTTACSISVTFTQCGLYSAQVCEALNPLNCALLGPCNFTVYNDQVPSISITPPSGNLCAGTNLCYALTIGNLCTTINTPVSGTVDWGDGSQLTTFLVSSQNNQVINVCHTYLCPGTYPIAIIVNTPCASNSANLNITVIPPQANFSYTVSSCKMVNFTDISSCGSQIMSWSWNFGDNTTSTSQNPSHTYANTGTYNVTLTVSDGCGNTTTITISVTLTPAPTVVIVPPPGDNTCNSASVYSATITGGTPGYSYSWSVSSGGTITSANNQPTVTVNWGGATSTQTVTLTITDAHGCITTVSLNVLPCCVPPIPTNTIYYINNTTASQWIATHGTDPNITGSNPNYTYNNTFGGSGLLYINGVFTIDRNITFTRSKIFMGPNAEIIIPNGSGRTLTICCSQVQAGCNYMWDGIFVIGTNSQVNINDYCGCGQTTYIRDADSAVVSQLGGIFQIDGGGEFFLDNYKDLVVMPYAGLHQGFIKRTTMRTLTGLIPPRSGQSTDIGIDVRDVQHLFIGDASAIGLTNKFNTMLIGIKSLRSSVEIVNNDFKNIIQAVPPSCCINTCSSSDVCGPNGMAIWIIGANPASTYSSIVGGTTFPNSPNTVTNCSGGVRVDNSTDVDINNNDFTLNVALPSTGVGVLVLNDKSFLPAHNIIIQNNKIHRFKIGVSTRFTQFSNLNILNNQIISIAPGANTTGIKVQDGLGFPFGHTNIQDNTIGDTWLGVVAIGMFGMNIDQGSLSTGNIITLSSTVSNQSAHLYGIWTQNVLSTVIAGNTITKGGIFLPTATAANGNWLGIRTDNSPGDMIDKNIIQNFGSGIFIFQACNGSNYACNTLKSCWFGVNFSTAALNNQLAGTVSQSNAYVGTLSANPMSGAVVITTPNTKWFYKLGMPYCGGFCSPLPSAVANLNVLLTTNNTDICPSLPQLVANPNVNQRDQMFGNIVRNLNQFSVNDQENRFAGRQYVHRMLKDHQAWLTLNDPSDTTFQNFYNSIENQNLGKFAKIKNHIMQGDTTNARNWNTSISPNNLMESNRQTVNEIYLNNVSRDKFSYSFADSATLYDIAIQNPLLGGDAVYSARVMLDMLVFDEDNNNGGRIRAPENDEAAPFDLVSKLYPNPNDGTMQLDYILPDQKIGQLTIYDLTGKKLSSYNLSTGQNSLQIKENSLENGIYLYRITVDGELKFADKLVIIK